MGSVQVKGLKFYAFHGCHPDERRVGGKFEVDIDVETDVEQAAYSDNLEDTVDYVVLMQIAEKQMKLRRDLIETVAQDIANDIKIRYAIAKKVEVTIKKHCAPVKYEIDYVSVKAIA